MNPDPSEHSGTRSLYASIQGVLAGRRWIPVPAQNKVPALIIAGILSIAAFWPSEPPSNDEIWAYRIGYGMGQTCRSNGGPDDPAEVAKGMSGMSGDEYDMFESGFTHGRKGRSAKYDAPESFERFSQPEFPSSADMAREFAEAHGYEVDQEPVNETPTPTQGDPSAAGDYIMDSLYGDSPSKPSQPEEKPR